MSEPFIGEIRILPYQFAPRGWAACNGQLLRISENTALFSLLGDRYGGDGRTTFGVPNLQARAAVGAGNGPGLTPRTLAQRGGESSVALTEQNLPNHDHTGRAVRQVGSTSVPTGKYAANDADPLLSYSSVTSGAGLAAMSASALQTAGGSNPHQNMQPYLAVKFCIAVEGLYPTRS